MDCRFSRLKGGNRMANFLFERTYFCSTDPVFETWILRRKGLRWHRRKVPEIFQNRTEIFLTYMALPKHPIILHLIRLDKPRNRFISENLQGRWTASTWHGKRKRGKSPCFHDRHVSVLFGSFACAAVCCRPCYQESRTKIALFA